MPLKSTCYCCRPPRVVRQLGEDLPIEMLGARDRCEDPSVRMAEGVGRRESVGGGGGGSSGGSSGWWWWSAPRQVLSSKERKQHGHLVPV